MATGALISVSEYLATHYRPDCEYLDGAVVKRNVGELDHSRLQKAILCSSCGSLKRLDFSYLPNGECR